MNCSVNGVVETEEVTNELAYARQVDAFAADVQGKAEFAVPVEEGWRNQLALDAVYRSLKTGRSEQVLDTWFAFALPACGD